MITGPATPYCPCEHRWLAHGLGHIAQKGGYGPCMVNNCFCPGEDALHDAKEIAASFLATMRRYTE